MGTALAAAVAFTLEVSRRSAPEPLTKVGQVRRLPFLHRATVPRPSQRHGETTRPPPGLVRHKYAVELCLVFGAYFLAGRAGLAVPFTSGNVSPVWPAAGIALAAFVVVGFRVWPAIAAAAFTVNYLSPVSFQAALAIAAGNTAGPAVGAW